MIVMASYRLDYYTVSESQTIVIKLANILDAKLMSRELLEMV